MRKLAIILIIVICSCENEFTPINPDAKPVPIVFGFIDTNDSIHTIRLTKTFTGTADAYELAKDTSNFLYDSVNMIIECLDINRKVFDTLTFHKTYFIPPATGIFNTGKSWYYVSKDKFPLEDATKWFRLKIRIYDTGDSVFSPDLYNLIGWDRIKIESPTKYSKYISVYDGSNTTAVLHQGIPLGVKLRFHYFEFANGIKAEKTVEKYWFNTKGIGAFSLSAAKLYMFIRNEVFENPVVDYRVFKSLDIISYGGPWDVFRIYYALYDTDNSFYSDVTILETPCSDVINGLGMFYEYTKDSVTGLKFDQKTLDSLAYGQFTKRLKFVPYQ